MKLKVCSYNMWVKREGQDNTDIFSIIYNVKFEYLDRAQFSLLLCRL